MRRTRGRLGRDDRSAAAWPGSLGVLSALRGDCPETAAALTSASRAPSPGSPDFSENPSRTRPGPGRVGVKNAGTRLRALMTTRPRSRGVPCRSICHRATGLHSHHHPGGPHLPLESHQGYTGSPDNAPVREPSGGRHAVPRNFETLAEAADATGGSVQSLSWISASAVRGFKRAFDD
jgi:hypothetical protein